MTESWIFISNMIKLKFLIEDFVRVEKSSEGLTTADGESGRGIYFSLSNYPSMIDYYRKNSGSEYRVIKAIPKSGSEIIDLSSGENLKCLIVFLKQEISALSKRNPGYILPKITASGYQRFGRLIQDYIRQYYPNADAYIVNHQADNSSLPKGKQLVIIDNHAFDYEEIQ